MSSRRSINPSNRKVRASTPKAKTISVFLRVQTSKRHRQAVSPQLVDRWRPSPFQRNRRSQSIPSVPPWPVTIAGQKLINPSSSDVRVAGPTIGVRIRKRRRTKKNTRNATANRPTADTIVISLRFGVRPDWNALRIMASIFGAAPMESTEPVFRTLLVRQHHL